MDEKGRFLVPSDTETTTAPSVHRNLTSYPSNSIKQFMKDENYIIDVYCIYCETKVIDGLLVPIGMITSMYIYRLYF
jgi:hypothetical protein